MISKTSQRVLPGRRTSMGVIPPALSTLSVSLIHGRFHAVAVSRGTVTGSWDAPGLVNEPVELASAVTQAVSATGYTGSTVRMVLAHPRLVSSLSAVPPAKGSSLQRVLERAVHRDKTFEATAAWCHQDTPPGKTGPTVLLHLFPASLLEQYSQACEKGAGLTLMSVVPACAVLQGQILKLPVSAADAVMVVAGLGSRSIVVVGQRDGQVLIARSVPASWTGNMTGLLGDLSGTVLYTKEQFGTEVTGIYLFGAEAGLHQADLQAPFEIPVRPSLADDVPGYWATEVLRLPPGMTPNLVSVAQQKAPQRRAMTRTVGWVTMVLMLTALGMLGWSHLHFKKLERELANLKHQRDAMLPGLKVFSESHAGLLDKLAVVAAVINERPDPLASLSLGYLSEVVPEELVLKDFSIVQDGPLWRISCIGGLLPVTNPAPDLRLSIQVAVLTSRLAQAPMNLLIAKTELSPIKQGLESAEAAVLDNWRDRVRTETPGPAGVAALSQEFLVEGISAVTYTADSRSRPPGGSGQDAPSPGEASRHEQHGSSR